jgi:hypothetical protein
LYFADRGNDAVRLITRGASSINIYLVAGRGTPCNVNAVGDGCDATDAILSEPRDVWVDDSGNLYIADSGNCRVRKVTPESGGDGKVDGDAGETITTIVGTGVCSYGGDTGTATSIPLNDPSGVSVNGAGDIFIADALNHCIRKVTAAGAMSTFAGVCGSGGSNGDGDPLTRQLNAPRDVWVSDATSKAAIADTGNQHIRVVAGGVLTTIAGTGVAGTGVEGALGTTSKIDTPTSVIVGSTGDVYFTDTNNHRVRRVNASTGFISTVVGGGTQLPPGPPLTLELSFPRGFVLGTCYDESRHIVACSSTTIDPATGQLSGGVSFDTACRGGLPAGNVDWLLPVFPIALIAQRRRLGRFLFVLSSWFVRMTRPATPNQRLPE